ncbi:uncharacterized protein LOC132722934 [Ruditapes philippinarum]|uniref:uncharacterized protein LOC132722934 n=1 Tax=Ruditapes philippinarum TaxID=129788 RepID=UPI00295C3854|nr:uncharacterized protein LOC132722934 [Ruditapes philippinarum]
MLRFLVFASLLGQFTVTGSSCHYKKILKRYEESCKRKQYLGDIFTDLETGGEIKSGVFLERLTSTCSNYAEYSKCANCTAKHICPEEQDKLREILAERWSIFCDGDQPASWLATILQNGFSYNVTCSNTFLEGFFSCMPQKSPERSSNETSLSGVADMHRHLRQDMFSCSLNGILKNGNGGCGSSWQDILLTNWLMTSLKFYKLFYIGTEEITQLQMMRCSNGQNNNV